MDRNSSNQLGHIFSINERPLVQGSLPFRHFNYRTSRLLYFNAKLVLRLNFRIVLIGQLAGKHVHTSGAKYTKCKWPVPLNTYMLYEPLLILSRAIFFIGAVFSTRKQKKNALKGMNIPSVTTPSLGNLIKHFSVIIIVFRCFKKLQ